MGHAGQRVTWAEPETRRSTTTIQDACQHGSLAAAHRYQHGQGPKFAGPMATRRVRLSATSQQSFDYSHRAQQVTINGHSIQGIQSTINRIDRIQST